MKKIVIGVLVFAAVQAAQVVKHRKVIKRGLEANFRLARGEEDRELREIVPGEEKALISSDLIHAHGAMLAVATTTEGVVLTRELLALNDRLIRFVYWHERGHIDLGHTELPEDRKEAAKAITRMKLRQQTRTLQVLLGQVTPTEIEADRYAADKVGTEEGIQALRELRQEIRRESGWLAAREIDLRIRALQ